MVSIISSVPTIQHFQEGKPNIFSDRWLSKRKYLLSHPLLQNEQNVRLLETSSEEADKLRRDIAVGSNILVVGGGGHCSFVYDKVKSQNVNLYIMDELDSDWARFSIKDLAERRIRGFIPCRLHPVEGIEQRAKNAFKSFNIEEDFFDAVTSYHDEDLYAAGLVAKLLDRDINDAEGYRKAINKYNMRKALLEANLQVPKFKEVKDESDMVVACEYVGFPAMVKLACGTHSLGVYKVENNEEAIEALSACRKTNRIECAANSSSIVLLEEFLQGIEIDANILLSFGKCVYAKVSDNWHQPPHFQDYGIHLPSRLDEDMQRNIINSTIDGLLALGFRNGSFDCEGVYTKDGMQFLEFNARVGCGPVVRNHEIIWGVDHMEQHTFAALGMPIKPVIPEKSYGYGCGIMINAPYSGTINSETWLDDLKNDPFVTEIRYNRLKGDEAVGPEKDIPTILAIINLASRESREAVNNKVLEVLKATTVPIDPYEKVERKPFYTPGMVFPFVPLS